MFNVNDYTGNKEAYGRYSIELRKFHFNKQKNIKYLFQVILKVLYMYFLCLIELKLT